MGFRRLKAKNLKEKHAVALVERWKGEGLSAGTLKNRMGVLRWVYDKVGKSWMLARSVTRTTASTIGGIRPTSTRRVS